MFFFYRHLFYLQVKQEILSKTLHIPDETKLVKIMALIAQEEFGDQVANYMHARGYQSFLDQVCPHSESHFLGNVARSHMELHGVSSGTAEYTACDRKLRLWRIMGWKNTKQKIVSGS